MLNLVYPTLNHEYLGSSLYYYYESVICIEVASYGRHEEDTPILGWMGSELGI